MNEEGYVRGNIGRKIKETIGEVDFIEEAVVMYFCATDPDTPLWAKALAFAALAYFIFPFDALPDPIYVDDAGVIAAALMQIYGAVTEVHRQQAHDWLHGADAGELTA